MLRDFARTHEVIIHGGSILEIGADEKIYNTSCAFGRDGTELARYRKIHLFDVETPDGKSYRESDTFSGGSEIITYRADDHVVGCSICYDLRFPELYQALAARAAEIIVVPAAFTMQTGKDHWEVLLRARAIETETYVLAAAQCGSYANGTRVSYGQSLMVDPWGHVIARRNDRPGIVTAQIDFDYLKEVRGMIPLRNHKRLKTSHSVGER